VSISIGQHYTGDVWGGSSVAASGTSTNTGSTLLVFMGQLESQTTPTPTTPTGYTLDQSHTADIYFWYRINAPSLTTLTVSLSGSGNAALHLFEIKSTLGTFTLDADTAAVSQSVASTTLTTNSLTTTKASASNNSICVAYFVLYRSGGTAEPSFSSPTHSYTLSGSLYQDTDLSSAAFWTGIYAKTVSANVSAENAGVTSTQSRVYSCITLSFNEQSSGGGLFRPWNSSHPGTGGPFFQNPACAINRWYRRLKRLVDPRYAEVAIENRRRRESLLKQMSNSGWELGGLRAA